MQIRKTKRKNKRGGAHIEMMISFIIFISFISFLFLIFKPFKVRASSNDLDVVEAEVFKKISTNLSVFSITINNLALLNSESCFYFDYYLDKPIVLKDENGEKVYSERKVDTIYFEEEGAFYRIYSADGLNETELSESGCYELQESDYIMGVRRKYIKVYYGGLENLNRSYNENYQQLKREMNIRNDFNFIVRNNQEILF